MSKNDTQLKQWLLEVATVAGIATNPLIPQPQRLDRHERFVALWNDAEVPSVVKERVKRSYSVVATEAWIDEVRKAALDILTAPDAYGQLAAIGAFDGIWYREQTQELRADAIEMIGEPCFNHISNLSFINRNRDLLESCGLLRGSQR